ncbi:esterase/lipase family protein [Aspergillus lucknowensis]|uniref:DUF676 domain-containing protein n=1 Tax=Aspergillus lucknowensis TaxID=176173 RepID=A0ABR4L5Q6_9EURO
MVSSFCSGWSGLRQLCSIWFVHGLFGNRETTWTHENKTFWPRLLADEFPTARVVTYGYDASVVNFSRIWEGTETSGLDNYGRALAMALRNSRQERKGDKPVPAINKPLYFIGHSLGGLVVEQALLDCIAADKTLHPVAAQTAGIIFMGTPHNGSHLAVWGKRLLKVFKAIVPDWIKNTNERVLKALESESEVGRKVQTDFQSAAKHGQLKHVRLYCFYETKPMRGSSVPVVPESSAVIRSDPNGPIHGTHREIVKFKDNKDAGYLSVKEQLGAWLEPPAHPEKPDGGQKPKKGGIHVSVVGARAECISGGEVDMSTMGAAGDFFDMRSKNNRGHLTGKEIHYHGNQWNTDEKWDTDEEKWDSDSDVEK